MYRFIVQKCLCLWMNLVQTAGIVCVSLDTATPARALQFYSRGTHISVLAAISTKGVLECMLVEGGVNADIFQRFLEE